MQLYENLRADDRVCGVADQDLPRKFLLFRETVIELISEEIGVEKDTTE